MTTRSKFERWWEESGKVTEQLHFTPAQYDVMKSIAKDAWQKASDTASKSAYNAGHYNGMLKNY